MIQWCDYCQEHFCENCEGSAKGCDYCQKNFHLECYPEHQEEEHEED